ncbi:Gfo/Idh/MocA family protein [Anaerotalea alkaliphila]|uniref:Gfo/Idh/MocA family oxidoreductase n=1 Tax=Anaerotalea alkaliphila TaxID=2662126 RepID=A0A7X5HVG2_9FIRM|nr:Gfo/Idh/MocA family oxidoreductase [Anaerotalea alkaliphila]NDL67390.1 Gfo/Idh/MocA family oxidoreductase [Anaerotalea alkaliphila]
MKPLRLGILGVSKHFITRIVLPLTQTPQVELYGIASRDLLNASNAAKTWGIQKAFGSYEEMLQDKELEAVYIPLPNHMHLEWAKKAMDAGKHVICEKPLAMDAAQVADLLAYSKETPVKVMEAFMYRFHPKWERAREIIRFGEIGDVTAIHTIFTYNNRDKANIRNIQEYGGGALYDIGCYAVSSARFLLGQEPVRVLSLMEADMDFQVDTLTSGIMEFPDARCLFTVGTATHPQQEVKVYGTGGSLTVTVPFNDHYDSSGELLVQNGLGTRSVRFHPVNQYRLEFEAFAKAIREDQPVPIPLEDSLQNMKVMDALFASGTSAKWEKVH